MGKSKQNKKDKKVIMAFIAPLNGGINPPNPDQQVDIASSDVEAALYRQADNPLGDPDKL